MPSLKERLKFLKSEYFENEMSSSGEYLGEEIEQIFSVIKELEEIISKQKECLENIGSNNLPKEFAHKSFLEREDIEDYAHLVLDKTKQLMEGSDEATKV